MSYQQQLLGPSKCPYSRSSNLAALVLLLPLYEFSMDDVNPDEELFSHLDTTRG